MDSGYLKKTGDLVLFYPAGDTFDLVGFVDADFTGYQVDMKSTSALAHFLGSSLISWGTKKQNSVALSTAEAEYVAATACCSQLLWIRQHLEDFGFHINAILTIKRVLLLKAKSITWRSTSPTLIDFSQIDPCSEPW